MTKYVYVYIYMYPSIFSVYHTSIFFSDLFGSQGTIFDAEQGSVALHQEDHAAEVGRFQQAALLFLTWRFDPEMGEQGHT